MADHKYFSYRGQLEAVQGWKTSLLFVTTHEEDHETGLYLIETEKPSFQRIPLAGGTALALDGDTLWIAGTDRQLSQVALGGKSLKPKKIGTPFESDIAQLAILSSNRLGLLSGNELHIVDRSSGEVLQSFSHETTGTALAADPTGDWIAWGDEEGLIEVLQSEEQEEFVSSASDRIHQGTVTSLLFEQEELRFLSTGKDLRLCSTHARGELEPEDRAGQGNHEKIVPSLLWANDERFLSGSLDGRVKSWIKGGRTRPHTAPDELRPIVDLTLVTIHERPHVAVACENGSIRCLLLDTDGKCGETKVVFHDALAFAKHELDEGETQHREAALKMLAEHDDLKSVELIAKQIPIETDPKVRLTATKLLTGAEHPRALPLLEESLFHDDEKVRQAAFEGLQNKRGRNDLDLLRRALESETEDLGQRVVASLEELSSEDDQGLQMLIGVLNHVPWEVRKAAMLALERVNEKDSPDASQYALNSPHADIRRYALIRFFERGLLDQLAVQSAVYQSFEDDEAFVRRTAFLVSLQSQPALASAVRFRDEDLHRQLHEIETWENEKKQKKLPKAKKADIPDSVTERKPLVRAMASRSNDVSLAGAQAAALLGDTKAVGLLLQLSHHEDEQLRIDACQSLALLSDDRSRARIQSLMLSDENESVVDAAFTAMKKIHQKDPLELVEICFRSQNSVNSLMERAFQLLVEHIRNLQKKKKKLSAEVLDLYRMTLAKTGLSSKVYDVCHQNAYSTAMNLNIGGDLESTFRFIIDAPFRHQNLYDDLVVYKKEKWAWPLFLELLGERTSDQQTQLLISNTFEDKKVKGEKLLEACEAGLQSDSQTVRERAIDRLIREQTEESQKLLATLIGDDDPKIRQRALRGLIGQGAEESVRQALESRHEDVRLLAARSRAFHGDEAAFDHLREFATRPQPETEEEKYTEWKARTEDALLGLGELGDPAAFPVIVKFIRTPAHQGSNYYQLLDAAAEALVSVSREEHVEELYNLLPFYQYQEGESKGALYLEGALIHAGEKIHGSQLFRPDDHGLRTDTAIVISSALLMDEGDGLILSRLIETNNVRKPAYLALLLLERNQQTGTPDRLATATGCTIPYLRFRIARALEEFTRLESYDNLLVEAFNNQEGSTDWKVSSEVVQTLGAIFSFGEAPLVLAFSEMLSELNSDQEPFFHAKWKRLSTRYAAEIQQVKERAKENPPAKPTISAEDIQQLVYGLYVGLLRDENASSTVKQGAMVRLFKLTERDETLKEPVIAAYLQTLSDPVADVRKPAFQMLEHIGANTSEYVTTALETGHLDLGVMVLKKLSGGGPGGSAEAVLENVMLTRTDGLALEAAKMLIEQTDALRVGKSGLEANSKEVRIQSLEWIGTAFAEHPEARQVLMEAEQSRYADVRFQAPFVLAVCAPKGDDDVFESISRLIRETRNEEQLKQILHAMFRLGGERFPDVILDRLENDPSREMPRAYAINTVGSFRSSAVVDRLLKLMRKEKEDAFYEALKTISGYDQYMYVDVSENEGEPDEDELREQHPRHDDVYAKLLEACHDLGWNSRLKNNMEHARWAKGRELNDVLAKLTSDADKELRNEALESYNWRVRKRGASVSPLEVAFQHKDPTTKFLAAVGLAHAGRNNGINLLLSLDLISDYGQRVQAVEALGHLADERALDVLMKYATEENHALQNEAIEALGHLSSSPQSEEIFELLKKNVKRTDQRSLNAMAGLRYFNTPESWKLIRDRIADSEYWQRENAVKQLAYHDDPLNREFLLKLLRDSDGYWFIQTLLRTASKLFGSDSPEPFYALMVNPVAHEYADDQFEGVRKTLLRTLTEEGDLERLLQLMPDCTSEMKQLLAPRLLQRKDVTEDQAVSALKSDDSITVGLAAHMLGRLEKRSKATVSSLQNALATWTDKWFEHLERVQQKKTQRMLSGGSLHQKRYEIGNLVEKEIGPIVFCLIRLVWSVEGAKKVTDLLSRVISHQVPDVHQELNRQVNSVRQAALQKLGSLNPKSLDKMLGETIQTQEGELSKSAFLQLLEHDPSAAEKLSDDLIENAELFETLARHEQVDVTSAIRIGAKNNHAQGVVLSHAVASGEISLLSEVMHDDSLKESTRLGAIEALGKCASESSEAELVKLGTNEDVDEDLRKAAWRARRRSTRSRAKLATTTTD